jgi:hypothetical protein
VRSAECGMQSEKLKQRRRRRSHAKATGGQAGEQTKSNGTWNVELETWNCHCAASPCRVRAVHAPCLAYSRAVLLNNPRACGARTLHTTSAVLRPNGAADCSHGWSTGRHMAGGAQPVEAFVFQHIRPFRGGGMCRTRGDVAHLSPLPTEGEGAGVRGQLRARSIRRSLARSPVSFAPPGRKEEDNEPVSFHGLRIGPHCGRRSPLSPPRERGWG